MRKKKDLRLQNNRFPVIADMLGVWEEIADESDLTDVLGSYTGAGQQNEPPEQDADDL